MIGPSSRFSARCIRVKRQDTHRVVEPAPKVRDAARSDGRQPDAIGVEKGQSMMLSDVPGNVLSEPDT